MNSDIRHFLQAIGVEPSLHEDTYINSQNGKEYPCFTLAKRECLGLAARYDVKIRIKK